LVDRIRDTTNHNPPVVNTNNYRKLTENSPKIAHNILKIRHYREEKRSHGVIHNQPLILFCHLHGEEQLSLTGSVRRLDHAKLCRRGGRRSTIVVARLPLIG